MGVMMAFIFIMSGFAIVADNSIGNTSISSGNMNIGVAKPEYNERNIDSVNINILGMNNFIARLFSAGKIDRTFIYNGIVIHEESNKIKNNEVKAHFFVKIKNFIKKTAVTIISKNNEYYIFDNKMNNPVRISSNDSEIIYDPGGTYYYYVSSSGSASHGWSFPLATGHWSACSKSIVKSDTAFITWSGPSVILVFGIPEFYASILGSYWKESNGDGWSASCGRMPPKVSGPEMPVTGQRTLHNYYGADTSVTVTVIWTYTPIF